jgi:hypothetical protein
LKCGRTCPLCGAECERHHTSGTLAGGRKLNHWHITQDTQERHDWKA